MMISPHDFDSGDVVHISAWKNPQKQRKPNADPAQRANNYWDLRGRWQREYDERLDALPDEGVADTAAGEIFRAATKLYYDFYNNAMVNNTSGAINYLAKTGVLLTKRGENDDNTFGTIYPYTIGSKIHFGELVIRCAIEEMIDRTIEFLRAHPELDVTINADDYHDLRNNDEKVCMERCAIRNRMAQEMNAEAMEWARDMERMAKKKAQDHFIVGMVVGSPLKSLANNNDKKDKKNKKWKKKASIDKSKSKDIIAKFSKLGMFD